MAKGFQINTRLNVAGVDGIDDAVRKIQSRIGAIKGGLDFQIDPSAQRRLQGLSNQVTAVGRSSRSAAREMSGLGVAAGSVSVHADVVNVVQKLGRETRNATRATRELKSEVDALKSQSRLAGEAFGSTARRYGTFLVVARGFQAVSSAIGDSISEAVKFQHEMVRLSQIGGTSARAVADIGAEVGRLATTLGASSRDLSQVSVTLRQAGLSATETKTALEALAKTTLAPTFESLKSTTEGVIAMRQQFGVTADEIEKRLGAINTVSGEFAVESEDLVTAIKKAGGAFKAASGDLVSSEQSFNQLLALFTSVRNTTRESADEIATGMRTIFARVQSNAVANSLKEMGVNLRYTREEAQEFGRDVEGRFVGAYEAVRRLAAATSNLPTTDPRFSQIVEQLGGFRQISRVIPLLQQFGTAQKAYTTAQAGANSLTVDAAKAQDSLIVKTSKLKEELMDLVRTFADNKGVQAMATTFLDAATAAVKLAKSIEPLVPLIAVIGSARALGAAKQFGIGAIDKFRDLGAPATKYPKEVRRRDGGVIPGHGSGDKVPLWAEPGEFVLRKSAARRIGYAALQEWNAGKYQQGGSVRKKPRGHSLPILTEPGEFYFDRREVDRIGRSRLEYANRTGRLPEDVLVKMEEADPRNKLARKLAEIGGMGATVVGRYAKGGIVQTPSARTLDFERIKRLRSIVIPTPADDGEGGVAGKKRTMQVDGVSRVRRRFEIDPVTRRPTARARFYAKSRQIRYSASNIGMPVPGHVLGVIGRGDVKPTPEQLKKVLGFAKGGSISKEELERRLKLLNEKLPPELQSYAEQLAPFYDTGRNTLAKGRGSKSVQFRGVINAIIGSSLGGSAAGRTGTLIQHIADSVSDISDPQDLTASRIEMMGRSNRNQFMTKGGRQAGLIDAFDFGELERMIAEEAAAAVYEARHKQLADVKRDLSDEEGGSWRRRRSGAKNSFQASNPRVTTAAQARAERDALGFTGFNEMVAAQRARREAESLVPPDPRRVDERARRGPAYRIGEQANQASVRSGLAGRGRLRGRTSASGGAGMGPSSSPAPASAGGELALYRPGGRDLVRTPRGLATSGGRDLASREFQKTVEQFGRHVAKYGQFGVELFDGLEDVIDVDYRVVRPAAALPSPGIPLADRADASVVFDVPANRASAGFKRVETPRGTTYVADADGSTIPLASQARMASHQFSPSSPPPKPPAKPPIPFAGPKSQGIVPPRFVDRPIPETYALLGEDPADSYAQGVRTNRARLIAGMAVGSPMDAARYQDRNAGRIREALADRYYRALKPRVGVDMSDEDARSYAERAVARRERRGGISGVNDALVNFLSADLRRSGVDGGRYEEVLGRRYSRLTDMGGERLGLEKYHRDRLRASRPDANPERIARIARRLADRNIRHDAYVSREGDDVYHVGRNQKRSGGASNAAVGRRWTGLLYERAASRLAGEAGVDGSMPSLWADPNYSPTTPPAPAKGGRFGRLGRAGRGVGRLARKGIGRIGRRGGLGLGASGIAAAALYADYFDRQGGGDYDSVEGLERNRGSRTTRGALTFGALGFQAGTMAGGPVVGVLAGLAGTLYGFANTTREIDKEIAGVKIGDSLGRLSKAMDDVAEGRRSVDGVVGEINARSREVGRLSAASAVGAGDNAADSIYNALADVPVLGRVVQSIDSASYGGLSFLGTSALDKEKAEAEARLTKERETLNPLLPQIRQTFQESLSRNVKLDPSLYRLTPGVDPEEQRRRRRSLILGGGGGELIRTIARVQKSSFDDVLRDFDRDFVQAMRNRQAEQGARFLESDGDLQLRRFERLGDALDAATSSLKGLREEADAIESLATGRASSTSISGISDRVDLIGGLDPSAVRDTTRFARGSLGSVGSGIVGRFGGMIEEMDQVRRELTGRLVDAASGGGTGEGEIIGTLSKAFEGFSPETQKRLNSKLDTMDPKTVLQELTANPEKLAQQIGDNVFKETEQVWKSVVKGLEGAFADYAGGRNRGRTLRGLADDTSDRRQDLLLQGRELAVENLRNLTGRNFRVGVEDRLSPVNAVQARLAGDIAFDPEAIGRRLEQISRETLEQQRIVQDPGTARDARKAAQDAFGRLTDESADLVKALERLSDSSSRLSAIQAEAAEVEKVRDSRLGLTERLLTADPRARMDFERGLYGARVAGSQGSFAGFGPEEIKLTLDALRAFGDANIMEGPLKGFTGKGAADRLIARSGGLVGVDNASPVAELATLQRGMMQVQADALKANEALGKFQKDRADEFFANLDKGFEKFFREADTRLARADVDDVTKRVQAGRAELARRTDVLQRASGVAGAFAASPDDDGLMRARRLAANADLPKLADALSSQRRLDAAVQRPWKLDGLELGLGDAGDLRTNAGRQKFLDAYKERVDRGRGGVAARTGLPQDVVDDAFTRYYAKVRQEAGSGDLSGFQTKTTFNQVLAKAAEDAQIRTNGEVGGLTVRIAEDVYGSYNQANGDRVGYGALNRGLLEDRLGGLGGVRSVNDASAAVILQQRDLTKANEDLKQAVETLNKTLEQTSPAPPAQYRAVGGPIFRRRGTDTVPAMLTPKEHVINARSAEANRPLLNFINTKTGPITPNDLARMYGIKDDRPIGPSKSFLDGLRKRTGKDIVGPPNLGRRRRRRYARQPWSTGWNDLMWGGPFAPQAASFDPQFFTGLMWGMIPGFSSGGVVPGVSYLAGGGVVPTRPAGGGGVVPVGGDFRDRRLEQMFPPTQYRAAGGVILSRPPAGGIVPVVDSDGGPASFASPPRASASSAPAPDLRAFASSAASVASSMELFAKHATAFSDGAARLADVLASNPIPSQINVQTNHRVEVLINGAQLIAAIKADTAEVVAAEVLGRLQSEITRHLRDMPMR